jgi:hypothetical protein
VHSLVQKNKQNWVVEEDLAEARAVRIIVIVHKRAPPCVVESNFVECDISATVCAE